MTSLLELAEERIVVGVDTHKNTHVAVILNEIGGKLSELSVPANTAGYQKLEAWATEQGEQITFGVEGTGSYGAGLASHLRRRGHRVLEVNRPNRQARRQAGKSDTLDAENAARAVLARTATALPKSAEGTVEMIRQVKIAKDTAVKSRTQAMVALKSLIVTAPSELREQLEPLADRQLIAACLALEIEGMQTPGDAARYSLRNLARRYHDLEGESLCHDRVLDTLTGRANPALTELFGVGADSAAELLIVAGDNPERIANDGALAKLCGACPIPASSGKTQRHRLNRGGHRQANAALHRILVVRMRFHQPTISYVARRTEEGKSTTEIMRCLKRFLVRELFHVIVPRIKRDTSTNAA
jgi:transposase